MYLSGAPDVAPPAELGARVVPIALGDVGTVQTLEHMRDVVHASEADRLTVLTARTIVAACDGHDYECQVEQIRAWLALHFRFVPDPLTVEGLWDVHDMLTLEHERGYFSGDCDEAAILAAALGLAIGRPAIFVVLGFNGEGPFHHTYTMLHNGTTWRELDVTRPFVALPPVTRVSEFPV